MKKNYSRIYKFFVALTVGNILITITDFKSDQVLHVVTGGNCGFKHIKKRSLLSGKYVTKTAIFKIAPFKSKDVLVILKGDGPCKQGCIRALCTYGFKIPEFVVLHSPIVKSLRLPKKRNPIFTVDKFNVRTSDKNFKKKR